MGFLDLIKGAVKGKPHAERKAECPKCKTANGLNAAKCSKCGYSLSDNKEAPAPTGVSYRCPICAYSADYYMLSCPSCGTRFV